MKISINELKKYVDIKIPDADLIKLIGARLVEVEGVEDWSAKYRGIYLVKVLSAEPIPDTHLHLCQIAVGAANSATGGRTRGPQNATHTAQRAGTASYFGGEGDQDPLREGGEYPQDPSQEAVQVVCGATNVREGMWTAWIAPGAIVPATFGTDDPFEIGARKLRGYDSHGMLAAADELALGTDHNGIIEIDPNTNGINGKKPEPGVALAEFFGLNDQILDIENKSLTHRPDCFGLIGFAREVAGILEQPFEEPDQNAELKVDGTPEIEIADQALCPRYTCAVLNLQPEQKKYFGLDDVFLAKAGMRSVSKIVDATNIIMLKTGQPLHAFDYDKFIKVGGTKTPKILVRAAAKGEKLELLDGKEIECTENDILITSSGVPVALAGAMGGKNTDIDENTKKIILESATFSLYHLRKTQMHHGIFSEAITRFTKGQPASQTVTALNAAMKLLSAAPLSAADNYPSPETQKPIEITKEEINRLLGTDYSEDKIIKTLENVGFKVKKSQDALNITAPSWRTDTHIKEDLTEEVGRLLGYDNIKLDLPLRPYKAPAKNRSRALKRTLRAFLSDNLAAYEVLTYSFVSKKLQERAGEDPENSYEIVNSISPELQCFRQSLTPSLLEKVRDNLKAGYENFSLYEINQTARKSDGLNTENVPKMREILTFVSLEDFYAVKAKLSALMNRLNLHIKIETPDQTPPYLEPLRSGKIANLGYIGEVKQTVLKNFKLPAPVTVFEIDLEKLQNALPDQPKTIKSLSKFPGTTRDLTLRVPSDLPYAAAEEAVREALAETSLVTQVHPLSVYWNPLVASDAKNLSFRLKLEDPEKTLNGAEISDIMKQVEESICKKIKASVV